MRIIAGSAKGRRLASPTGPHTRAVLDQVKEAIFNILFDVTDLDILDLFAGTGSIGLEALSRGAKKAVFVDSDNRAVKVIKENIKRCGFEKESGVIPLPVNRAIKQLGKQNEKFDLIFIDPPYEKDLVAPTIRKVHENDLLTADGMIITEHHPKEPIGKLPDGLKVCDERKYGQTLVTFINQLLYLSSPAPPRP